VFFLLMVLLKKTKKEEESPSKEGFKKTIEDLKEQISDKLIRMKWLQTIVKIKSFVKHLLIVEISAIIGYVLTNDLLWAAVSLALIAAVWFVKSIIFYNYVKKDENSRSTLSAKRWVHSLVILNQTQPLLEEELNNQEEMLKKLEMTEIKDEESEQTEFLQPGQETILEQNRKALGQNIFCGVVQDFGLVVLNSFILSQTFGMEAMCLPDYFDSSLWAKSRFELKSRDISQKILRVEKMFDIVPTSSCSCDRWTSGSEFCFSSGPNSGGFQDQANTFRN
jgi:hypothetical protein